MEHPQPSGSGSSGLTEAEDPVATSPGVSRIFHRLSGLSLWLMIGFTLSEVAARSLFNRSFGLSDEVGGYLLIALAFLSLPACHAEKMFHGVEFIQTRLSSNGRAVSGLLFDVLCLGCASILLWQAIRLVGRSYRSGETSQMGLEIPLWMPQSLIAIGLAALVWALLVSIGGAVQRPRVCQPEPVHES